MFTEADVAALRTVTDLRQAGVMDATSELALARALGQAMAGLSEPQMTLLRNQIGNQITATGRPDTEAASAALARAELSRLTLAGTGIRRGRDRAATHPGRLTAEHI